MMRATTCAIGVLLLCAVAIPVHATTITVTNTNNSGLGSLRQALADAGDGDTLTFGVTGAIQLTSGGLGIYNSITNSGPGGGWVRGFFKGVRIFPGNAGLTGPI